jgi:hypothetical protein
MRRSSWYALMFVAAIGCGIAGLIAFTLVAKVGWLGILIIGLAICRLASVERHPNASAVRTHLRGNEGGAVRQMGRAR